MLEYNCVQYLCILLATIPDSPIRLVCVYSINALFSFEIGDSFVIA